MHTFYLADKITCRYPVECYVMLWLLTENLLTPSFPLEPPTILLLCFGWSKKLFAATLHKKMRKIADFLQSARFPVYTSFLSLMSTFLPEKNAVWQLLSSTIFCPCIVHFFYVLLYIVQSCHSILQTAKLVRWKCWTIEICTDTGITKPIQPDTLTNKMNPHYSMCWKCIT